MEKSGFKKRNIVLIAVSAVTVLVCLVLLPVGIAYGWFESSKNKEFNTGIIPPAIKVTARFEVSDGVYQEVVDPGFIEVELTDKSKANHFSKLRVTAVYNGNIDCAMRVAVTHLWRQGQGESPNRASVDFSYDTTNFIDNSKFDGQYYFCRAADYQQGALGAYTLSPTSAVKEFNVITGVNKQAVYETGVSLILMVQGELVQVNRAESLWGTLPSPPSVI